MGSCSNKQNKEEHKEHIEDSKAVYTCPMHPEIIRNLPGSCPICHMDLVKKESDGGRSTDVELEVLLRPTNEFVVATIPVTTAQRASEEIEIKTLGTIAYDTRSSAVIAALVSGRIEKLYVRYRFQEIRKGQKILDIYSPELMTAQQNLLFLLTNDEQNHSMIEAARQRLLLLGMTPQQISKIIRTGQPSAAVAIYSPYNGHIHEAGATEMGTSNSTDMKSQQATSSALAIREGMYVEKGQSVLSVLDPSRIFVALNISGTDQSLVKRGDPVHIIPETSPDSDIRGKIDYIEPFFQRGNRSLSVRVYLQQHTANLPVGSPVTATIRTASSSSLWVPRSAILSLGLNQVVFQKVAGGFIPKKVSTGIVTGERISIQSGLSDKDSIAINAQFLTDSESFIKAEK